MPRPSLTREALYELVWSKPISQFSKDFGISDRGLGKVCSQMEIPMPGRGYWAKVEHGHTQDKEPLEPPSKNCQLLFDYYPTSPETAKGIPLDQDSLVQQAIDYESNPENKIIVPEKVHRYYPEVKKTIDALSRGRSDKLCRSPNETLALVCTKRSLPRAARIYQTLIKAFKQRGHNLNVHFYQPYRNSYEKCPETAVNVFGVYVRISLSEKTDKVPITPNEQVIPFGKKYHQVPNGKLILRLEYPKVVGLRTYWADTAGTPLEEKLNNFVLEVIKVAVFKKHQNEIEEEKERLREIRRIQQEEETARRKHLSKAIEDWENAQEIREFIKVLEKRPSSLTFRDMTQQDWIKWAKDYADQIDPISSGEVVSLSENSREYHLDHSLERGFWQKWYSTPQNWP